MVGMSLGGLTSMELAVRDAELVRRLVMVDITPGVNQQKAKAVIDFVDGPQEFASFDDLLARTMKFNPTRSESSLRRGILHNAAQRPDGSWQWRYDRSSHARSREPRSHRDPADPADPADPDTTVSAMSPLWDDFVAVGCRWCWFADRCHRWSTTTMSRDARRLQPDLDVHVVDGAGHSVQGDRPVELATLLGEFVS